jgi:DNA-binding LacI/PurR family transcriptional regulator
MAKSDAESKKIQMVDIARMAGVSTSTVSRALNGSPLINEETRQRIADLAKSLSYSINLSAKNLRSGDNRTIGVVIPYQDQIRQDVTDPFFMTMLGHLADQLTKQNFDLLFSRIAASQIEDLGQLYESGRVGGLIVVGQWDQHEKLNDLARRQIPFVVWGGHLPRQLYCTVGGDNLNGGYLATHHLLSLGRRRIVFMGDKEATETQQRYEGYLQAHAEFKVAHDAALYVPSPFTVAEARVDINEFLKKKIPFDSLFAASDLLAITAMGAITQNGSRIPQDISVVGYDDIGMAEHTYPPLTTIRQPMDLAGQALVQNLMLVLSDKHADSQVVKTDLIIRNSTCPV